MLGYDFDGIWSGDLTLYGSTSGDYDAIEARDAAGHLRLRISGDRAEVLRRTYSPVMTFNRLETNAMFSFIHAEPKRRDWVETQTFMLTPLDNNRIWVVFSRMVNNTGLETEQKHSKFAIVGIGTLERL